MAEGIMSLTTEVEEGEIEDGEDGEIKDFIPECFVILSETEDEPELIEADSHASSPKPNVGRSRSTIAKELTLGSLLIKSKKKDRPKTHRPSVGSRSTNGRIRDSEPVTKHHRKSNSTGLWGNPLFSQRGDRRNTTNKTSSYNNVRNTNDIWQSKGRPNVSKWREEVQRRRKADVVPRRRSKSKEFDTLLRDYRDVQRAIKVEEARQNASATYHSSSMRRSLPRKSSRLPPVTGSLRKRRSKSKGKGELAKDVPKEMPTEKPKPKEEEDDDEMTELELRMLALVSAKKAVEQKKETQESNQNSSRIDVGKSAEVLSLKQEKEGEKPSQQEADNYEEVAMDVDDDIVNSDQSKTIPMRSAGGEPPTQGDPVDHDSNKSSGNEDDEEEELALRAALLRTMATRKNIPLPKQSKPEDDNQREYSPKPQETEIIPSVTKPQSPAAQPEKKFTYKPTRIVRKPVIPTHGPLVITVTADSDSSDDDQAADSYSEMMDFLKQARNSAKPVETVKGKSSKEDTKEDTREPPKVGPKTPDAFNKLPETHRAEYRRLKEEIARREQKKVGGKAKEDEKSTKDDDAQLKKIAALEDKLKRNRSAIEKDYHAYQESARHQAEKSRIMQRAQFRIQRLREQIAVMENVVVLNRNLVKKYSDEQKNHLSSMTASVSVEAKLREELSTLRGSPMGEFPLVSTVHQLKEEHLMMEKKEAQKNQEVGPSNHTSAKRSKVARNQASELHRLKQVEEELALKIKQYRESQAREGKSTSTDSTQSSLLKRKLNEGNIRPAVSIYKKDKIQFSVSNTPTQTDSETEKENDGGEKHRRRRRSWLDDKSSLTPQLAAKKKSTMSEKANSQSYSLPDGESTLNLTLEKKADFKRQQGQDILALRNELNLMVQTAPRSEYMHPRNYFSTDVMLGKKRKMLLPGHSQLQEEEDKVENIKFESYQSPLIGFRAYRLHQAFWKAANLSPLSRTFSHNLDPKKTLCKFELNGVCNDGSCKNLHERDYILSEEAILSDLLSYAPSLVGITSDMSIEAQNQKVSHFLKSLIEQLEKENPHSQTKERLEYCIKTVLKHLKKENIEFPVLCERKWRPNSLEDCKKHVNFDLDEDEDMYQVFLPKKIPETVHILGQDDKSSSESLDRALNALSRGLEHNPNSSDLWKMFLSLYASRTEHPDLSEICTQAMQYTKDYRVYWQCLQVAETFQAKMSACQEIFQLLTSDSSATSKECNSHRFLETLLYQTQIHILTGRLKEAFLLLKNALSVDVQNYVSYLTKADTCLAWICYIHLVSFRSLPPCLFEESGCGLGHVIKKSPFICPWHQPLCATVDEILDIFKNVGQSLSQCEDLAVWSNFFHNWIALLNASDRKNEAIELCKEVIGKLPEEKSFWKCLLLLEMKNTEDIIKVREIYYEAFSRCSLSPEIYYTAARLEHKEGFCDEAISLLYDCATAFYELPSTWLSNHENICNLYRYLLHQPVDLSFKLPTLHDKYLAVRNEEQVSLWLSFCFLSTLKSTPSGELQQPKEAFEAAISSLSNRDGVLDVWLQYLLYELRRPGIKAEDRGVSVRRIVKSLLTEQPSLFTVPFEQDVFFVDYSFHNCLLDVYFSYLDPTSLGEAYEEYVAMMPANIGLLKRFLDFLWNDEAYHYIKFLAKSALRNHPQCVHLWNVLLRATGKSHNPTEVLN
ncbi:Zinc finger C3H1 domain-containing protein [Holothuria leucospilota]|uniref:Zinc finger C3H1 domain-containing protein n=1 Tax=Holothuria leucospilota TaxID=206669 RepID=A0A9Q1H237_HOLLE|nr:Zinc finger C3H1 domain-containing protein [Holothuria leucospilota]